MIRLYAPTTRPFSDVSYFGLVISGDARQRHVGVLCNQGKNDIPSVIHLAFHFSLRLDPPDSAEQFWVDCDDAFGEEERAFFSSWLMKVWEKNQGVIPYGLNYSNDVSLFGEDARYSDVSIGAGLTCATFVLSVLKSVGFPVVDIDTWTVRSDDVVWQNKILSYLERDRVENPLRYTNYPVEDQNRHVGKAVRVRPEEAVAAVHGYEGVPMPFDEAEVRGACVLGQLLAWSSGASC